MKNTFSWDVTPCGSYKNRSYRGTYRLYHEVEKNQLARNNITCNSLILCKTEVFTTVNMKMRLLGCDVVLLFYELTFRRNSSRLSLVAISVNVVFRSVPFPTQLPGAIFSSETPVLTRATRRRLSEDGILQPCFIFPF
jgi:hypothetical protein